MLSVIIPTLNPGDRFSQVLASVRTELGPLGAEIIVASAGLSKSAIEVCHTYGAQIIDAPKGRGLQMIEGAKASSQPWLMFLHADSILQKGSGSLAAVFMVDPLNDGRAGYYRLAYDEDNSGARRIARLANWRAKTFGLPYGDQAMLISRQLYDGVGGFAALPLMEDVDLVRRLGRHRLVQMNGIIETSAERYAQDGYWLRPIRNLLCLTLYFCRVPNAWLRRLYGGPS